jgi:hypothetical protein
LVFGIKYLFGIGDHEIIFADLRAIFTLRQPVAIFWEVSFWFHLGAWWAPDNGST